MGLSLGCWRELDNDLAAEEDRRTEGFVAELASDRHRAAGADFCFSEPESAGFGADAAQEALSVALVDGGRLMGLPLLTLRRFFYGRDCTLGYLTLDSGLIYTLEDAWAGNAVGQSCIPDGTYRCRPRFFNGGGYPAIEVADVPGRTTILFHRGNVATDVRGCIVVGTQLGSLGGQLAVINSAAAWSIFHHRFGYGEFDLSIEPVPPLQGARL